MAFGINRKELLQWKRDIDHGKIAFITHYWLDDRFPDINTVTKVGCKDLKKLSDWGIQYGLKKEWIHLRKDGYSHFDLLGQKQLEILQKEGLEDQLKSFSLLQS
ncbi:hypothetical protein KHA96_04760 [Bacillus sp. FJAT-49711]|uniref:hypothetical protein n=1 Tax=Bacillus sp. FJAT-49711 TaxID=2833585 RepID=UPI001BCA0070|nr:hypothetical protein [Bacillus sp. FJAT-49711]MBS4217625.1 hypothetical protein [Bacillus sp. FJAT-49711]